MKKNGDPPKSGFFSFFFFVSPNVGEFLLNASNLPLTEKPMFTESSSEFNKTMPDL